MKKYSLVILIAIVFLVIGGFVVVSKNHQPANENTADPPSINQYFWSETCPHCAKVAEFLDGWDKKDKFQLEKFEINESSENRLKFYKMGMFCEISRDNLGVPFLVTSEGKCFIGDEPIIGYLESLDI
ncbi:hypothetical protein A2962_04225 [Candidatus Woesebacteria bacterium RIFCSPLOWO2_01_FULL_39_61]|uniref:Thioredoxin domain-containing protein n=1 Tax=Candidatus Woesebacteria bacterium RIFCSPHIGHO2_02_FULL_39_13 TaxID=1802505 RepID=A0A1F7YZ61_9BACT|nr:MAG: hypothetical protein A2692_05210 [Candidatus Woesebacteria bacterium RIFCSPHIGHO2_01_FULL_39_95]OGM32169.1 MAG: hypothetical protein A3D01_02165 [Candidatus Woesebacteria bacterium RIFCSPHIGHO2_02_FULL_39_13]OGM36536.1 MAG: hypothetical protein A3E13_04270 [Candidatus Woesebacteria bacterium RIFCSPHIGHO2_12_FULL_40_20]OGM65959.1 MAG: hypothetical protein A2962_04225 [Candidatus Woesebacteria bacterium RIFCSPLOWO2_01_FULL_39_61]OGM71399.1 MAG: hypothetical protein A3H19_04505 [Candidatus